MRSGSEGAGRGARVAALVGALALSVCLGACEGEIDPGRVEATLVAAGRFEVAERGPVLVEEGERIRCAPGVVFGVDYRVSVEGGGAGVLPVSFWWVHPEFAIPSQKLWGTETPARPSNPRLARGEAALSGRALWTLDDPEERVDGDYRFEIRRVDDGRAILVVPFEIEGC